MFIPPCPPILRIQKLVNDDLKKRLEEQAELLALQAKKLKEFTKAVAQISGKVCFHHSTEGNYGVLFHYGLSRTQEILVNDDLK